MTGVFFNIRDNQAVRIDGRAYIAGGATDGGRRFTARETGDTLVLSNHALMTMAREQRILSETMHESLTLSVLEALTTDWDSFTPAQRLVALERKRFITRLETLGPDQRHKKAGIEAAIEAVMADEEPPSKRPTVRSVRRWHLTFVAAGKDIRALIDMSMNRGSREDRMPAWMIEEIDKAIRQVHATSPAGSLAATRKRAITLIRERSAKDNLALPDFGQKDILGKNAIKRRLKQWDNYDVLQGQVGRAEADRIMTAVGIGPQGERPLSEVEVDHTLLDVLVVGQDDGQIYGRPWLTTFMDRYSRCIIGFSIAFHPPSWTSLMEALRNAVSNKTTMLAALGGIHCAWECQGVPEELICDNGKDFHSTSMRETQAVLSMRVLYVGRKKGWLKGKMERWYRTLEEQVIHLLPGTTFSNVLDRKHYDSAEFAVLSIQQLNWLVTKWIVDVYHQTDHSALSETPAERWHSGVRKHGLKLPPDPGLLQPLTGLVIKGTLSRTGVQYKELRWNGNAFSGLLNRLKRNTDVQIRIDTQDLSRAYVYDEERRRWIEGGLMTREGDGLTLHQYLVIRAHAKKIRLPDETKAAALSRSHGEIFDFVQDVKRGARKADKRLARFAEDGRKPSEHIEPGVRNPEASRSPLGAHPVVPRSIAVERPTPLLPPPPGHPPPSGRQADAVVPRARPDALTPTTASVADGKRVGGIPTAPPARGDGKTVLKVRFRPLNK